MKLLILLDKFKGTLTSREAGQALALGLGSEYQTTVLSVADGGQGLLETLEQLRSLETFSCTVRDPLERPVVAQWALDPQTREAFIESSQANGIHLLKPEERDPLRCTTHGLGDLIAAVLEHAPARIYIGLGGSATVDGGIGCLSTLGYGFKNAAGHVLSGIPLDLGQVAEIQPIPLPLPPIFGISDVLNPPIGPQGGVQVYGPQKGGSPEVIERLESDMAHYIEVLNNQTGQDWSNLAGGGAAGCLGLGLAALLNMQILPGARWLIQALDLANKIEAADWVITGEGKYDGPSHEGKIPIEIINLAKQYATPVALVTGATIDLPVPPEVKWQGALADVASDTAQDTDKSRLAMVNLGQQLAIALKESA